MCACVGVVCLSAAVFVCVCFVLWAAADSGNGAILRQDGAYTGAGAGHWHWCRGHWCRYWHWSQGHPAIRAREAGREGRWGPLPKCTGRSLCGKRGGRGGEARFLSRHWHRPSIHQGLEPADTFVSKRPKSIHSHWLRTPKPALQELEHEQVHAPHELDQGTRAGAVADVHAVAGAVADARTGIAAGGAAGNASIRSCSIRSRSTNCSFRSSSTNCSSRTTSTSCSFRSKVRSLRALLRGAWALLLSCTHKKKLADITRCFMPALQIRR